jgi:hypothetical protein
MNRTRLGRMVTINHGRYYRKSYRFVNGNISAVFSVG